MFGDSKLIPKNIDYINSVPDKDNIYRAMNVAKRCAKIRLVFIGQDPYYTMTPNGACTATGLAFDARGSKVPASLQVIYKTLHAHGLIPHIPKCANIAAWADRGCILLNTALTTKRGMAGAHIRQWKPFIVSALSDIHKHHPDAMFLLLGSNAQKIAAKAHIPPGRQLHWGHPSPINTKSNFIECPHFKDLAHGARNNIRSAGAMDWRIDSYYLFTDGSRKKESSGWAWMLCYFDPETANVHKHGAEIYFEDDGHDTHRAGKHTNMRGIGETNNRQELRAFVNAANELSDMDAFKDRTIIWATDSKYALGAFLGGNTATVNQDLINEGKQYIKSLKIYGIHVTAHRAESDAPNEHDAFLTWGNNYVDDLAVNGPPPDE